MDKQPSPALRRAAQRALDEPFFLAGVLHTYQQTHGLDDAALATWLGCARDDLARLALCRRPREAAAAFQADLAHLATRFGLQANRLATMIREVAALEAIQQHMAQAQGTRGMLRAARDREDADEIEAGEDV